jgi:hypothetical protein
MTPLRLALWVLLAMAQLCVPAWMIVGQERILRGGTQVKLHTRPVDPADFFSGRYVALGFKVEQVPRELVRGHFMDPDETAYLELREGADGFAEIIALHKEKPPSGLVLQCTIQSLSPPTVEVALPFNRYYMDEHLAPEADRVYRAQAADPVDSFVLVRVLDGRGVIEELYLGGKPVAEFLRQNQPPPE